MRNPASHLVPEDAKACAPAWLRRRSLLAFLLPLPKSADFWSSVLRVYFKSSRMIRGCGGAAKLVFAFGTGATKACASGLLRRRSLLAFLLPLPKSADFWSSVLRVCFKSSRMIRSCGGAAKLVIAFGTGATKACASGLPRRRSLLAFLLPFPKSSDFWSSVFRIYFKWCHMKDFDLSSILAAASGKTFFINASK